MLFSAVGLLLLSPVLLLVALAIKLGDGGPVLYRQERIGRDFRPFRIFKFRTMVVGADRIGPGLTLRNDPRVTRVGRFLRWSKLDELPQLVNVLKGDMSLVGPRPELGRYVEMFREDYRQILKVRPGITDPASIAYRQESLLLGNGEDPEAEYVRSILPDKIRLARASIEDESLGHDVLLLLRTLATLLYPAGLLDRVFGRLSRHQVTSSVVVQALLCVAATVIALEVRFGGAPPPHVARLVLLLLPALLVLRLLWLGGFNLYRDIWQYVSLPNLGSIIVAVGLSSASFWLLLHLPLGLSGYPRAIVLLDGLLCVVGLVGIRVLRRLHEELRRQAVTSRRLLVVGSHTAHRTLRELADQPGFEYRLIGLVTDTCEARGFTIQNVPIVGCYDDLESIVRAAAPDEILVIASAIPEERRQEVIRRCRKLEVPVKIMPGLDEMISGRILSAVEAPGADDVLFRKPVEVNLQGAQAGFRQRRILVTGAGGTIGAEICRQLAACRPSRLVLFEKHEQGLFDIERELLASHPGLPLDARIGDIRDRERVVEIFTGTRPEIVFHAAAYKHVPMMEHNPWEAVKTNVVGTRILGQAAHDLGVESFVLISTDKSVEPVCVMGATKRMAELTIQAMAESSLTRFLTVRFGNVLGSSGSVIPIFREQIVRRAPVTITHPDVARWFMTVPEAVQLVLEAATLGRGGEVFVLDMGKPIRIVDLAQSLIRQYGLRPGVDIPIVFTGLRPGERLFEKLFNDRERVLKTAHSRILMAVERNGNGKSRPAGKGNGDGAGPDHAEEMRRLVDLIEVAAARIGARSSSELVQELAEVCG